MLTTTSGHSGKTSWRKHERLSFKHGVNVSGEEEVLQAVEQSMGEGSSWAELGPGRVGRWQFCSPLGTLTLFSAGESPLVPSGFFAPCSFPGLTQLSLLCPWKRHFTSLGH